MTTLTPARKTAALLALALGGFAIGTTEFVAMGLLPNLASSLLHHQYVVDPEAGIAHAGWLVSAYALGVVVGAPTIAAAAARFPRKQLLLGLLVGFTLATVASAVLPSFGLVLAARFVAGLPHGAYFGIASLVAAEIMGPGSRGKGVSMVLGGLTIANVVGVPLVTFIGQHAGWRAAYLIVAALFALTFVAVATLVPFHPAEPGASFRRELRAFRVPQVWIMMACGAIGFGGFFAVYSYISPLVQHVTHLPVSFVPFVLVTVGVGMTVGNIAGGHFADVDLRRAMYVGFAALIAALLLVTLTAATVVGLFVGMFALGATSSMISPSVQSRLMDVAGESKGIAAALNHSAFNIGNSLGALLGGSAIAAGWGYAAPGWIGIVLALLGLGIITISFSMERRTNRRTALVRDQHPRTGPITSPVPTV
ncbi:MFS transporter [Curtobacterium sp. MCBD17_040]|uniref:MFS transporter n=1 Tax=Curtobacterium sp. MCBD17_040 TaxID=2175674 RepID=UPI000DA92D11|nr:MFS transporter [Curtobacterium sp. MCBD17_040]WIB62393.1 MFS transporter [Curtobacterium sp. MCBD17_040]